MFPQVPCALVVGQRESVTSLVEFGHGIFGNRGIALDKWLQRSANREGWLVWSADWRGLSIVDVIGMWRLATHDMSEYRNIEAAVIQSFASKTALRLALPSILEQEGCRLKLCGISTLSTQTTNSISGHSDVIALFPNETAGVVLSTTKEASDVDVPFHLRSDSSLTTSPVTSFAITSRRMISSSPSSSFSSTFPSSSTSTVDISKVSSLNTAYIGHSMGSIIGVAWVAFAGYARSAHIAGGSPFSFVVGRSAAFALMQLAFDLQFYKR